MNSQVPLQPVWAQYPWVWIDQSWVREDGSLEAVKTITQDEWCLVRVGSGQSFFPPALLLEVIAQAAGRLDEARQTQGRLRQAILARIPWSKFYFPVGPGDVLKIIVKPMKQLGDAVAYFGTILVDGRLAGEGELYLNRFSA